MRRLSTKYNLGKPVSNFFWSCVGSFGHLILFHFKTTRYGFHDLGYYINFFCYVLHNILSTKCFHISKIIMVQQMFYSKFLCITACGLDFLWPSSKISCIRSCSILHRLVHEKIFPFVHFAIQTRFYYISWWSVRWWVFLIRWRVRQEYFKLCFHPLRLRQLSAFHCNAEILTAPKS